MHTPGQPKGRVTILSEVLDDDYRARVAAAGGHFRFLPVDDAPTIVHVSADGAVRRYRRRTRAKQPKG